MRKTTELLSLSCQLNDDDKIRRGQELADHLSRKSRIEESLKAYIQNEKAQISEREKEIARLTDIVNTGREYRQIDCTILYDWQKKTKTWIRTDTGDEAKQDIISDSELQEQMELEAAANAPARISES